MSQDILNITLSVATVIATIFGGMFLYYLAMIMRQSFLIIKEMRGRLFSLDNVLTEFKIKLFEEINHFTHFLEMIKSIIAWMRLRSAKKDLNNKTKKQK